MGWTQAQLRAPLRTALLDTAPPLLWSDAVLDGCVTEAVTTHSLLFPQATTVYLDVAAGQQEFPVYVWAGAGPAINPPPTSLCDVLAVQAAELPAGQPLPPDPGQTTDPAGAGSPRYSQGYRWRGTTVRLTWPASAAEAGPAALRLDLVQTWPLPDDGAGSVWTGPAHDVPLLLLLARRAAYQHLAEWQARTQGTGPALTAGGQLNLHLDVPAILAALEVQIARALALRRGRNLRSRALDI